MAKLARPIGAKKAGVKPEPAAARPQRSARPKQGAEERAKQAVVIVHGIGEQRLLSTLRSFAEAVWGGSTVPNESDKGLHHDMWIVPDTRAGLMELARIRTRSVQGRATDFYELYWADKLTGNTLAQLRTWIFTLLLRWPHQVPKEIVGLWLGLWAVTLLVVGLFVWVGKDASLAGLLNAISGDWLGPAAVANTPMWLRIACSVGVAVILAWVGIRYLRASLRDWAGADEKFRSTWQGETAIQASLPAWLGWIAALAVPVAAGYAAYLWVPWAALPGLNLILIGAAVAATVVLTKLVVPYLGDVARYVRTAPDAVSARADIRERGLELMRALHGVRDPLATKSYDYGNQKPYDRIIVVGHSLGSIIAYDVLRLFWEEIGPTGQNPPSSAVLGALRSVDTYCRTKLGQPQEVDPATYRLHQKAVIDELQLAAAKTPGRNWLISDFVTLGSPLTHADFLVTTDRHEFEKRKAERQLPVAPPMLEPVRDSFLYTSGTVTAAHHAAMFSATRWVNIFDPRRLGLFGDLVGGPCKPNFGPGLVDVPVQLDRGGWFGRVFTHTKYWDKTARAQLMDDAWLALEDDQHKLEQGVPAHIAVLRLAMQLKRRTPSANKAEKVAARQ